MSNWKSSAQYILESNNYVQPANRNTVKEDKKEIDLWQNNPVISDKTALWDTNTSRTEAEKSRQRENNSRLLNNSNNGRTENELYRLQENNKVTNKKDTVGNWLGKQAMSGVDAFNKNIAATADFLLPTEFLGKYDFVSKINDYYSKSYNNRAYTAQASSISRGKGWKTIGDLVSGTIAALPNAIISLMSAGVSNAANGATSLSSRAGSASGLKNTAQALKNTIQAMLRNPMYWTSAAQTLGTDYEEAKERGANDFVAASAAIITTALNAGIEVGGGIETLPQNIKTGEKNAVLSWVKSAFEEGREEVLQSITSNAAAKLLYDRNSPIYSTQEDTAVINPIKLAKDFGMGAAIGGILGAGEAGVMKTIDTAQIIKTGKYFNKPDIVQSVIDTGLESPKDTVSYKLAKKAQSKKGKLSDYDVGRLYYANVIQIEQEEKISSDETTENNTSEKQKSERYTAHNDTQSSNQFTSVNNESVRNNNFSANENNMTSTAAQNNTASVSDTNENTNEVNTPQKSKEISWHAPGSNKIIAKSSAETKNIIGIIAERYPEITINEIEKTLVPGEAKNVLQEYINIGLGGEPIGRYFTDTKIENATGNADTANVNEVSEKDINSSDEIRLSGEKAQLYNILSSNLKNAASDLKILDRDFFDRLKDINIHSLSASDVSLINSEFHRIFANVDDDLISSWLAGLDKIQAQLTNSNNESASVSYATDSAQNDTQNSAADKNLSDTDESTIKNETITNADTGIIEGEILSLKHTRNIYSLFKSADRIVVGKDIITDGFVVVPLTDATLDEVKKFAGDIIQENPNMSLSKLYHKDNDVIIQGNPKTDEIYAKTKAKRVYVFKIGNDFYTCQQKFIDAFNNGKNIITANKQVNVPWNVHNENGEFVALFLGANHAMNDERFNSLQSVSEIKAADKQKKVENLNKPFNQNEVRQLINGGTPFFFTVHGINFVGNGHVFIECDNNAGEFIKSEYRRQNANSNYEIKYKDGSGSMVEKVLSEANELAEASNPILHKSSTSTARGTDNAYVVGDYAILYNNNYANIIKKRSSIMKIISGGSLNSTFLIGYDSDGNVTGFALPIRAEGYVTTKDGKNVSFVKEPDIKVLVKEAAPNVIKSDKDVTNTSESVTKATESVIKKTDSVMEAPQSVAEPEYTHLYDEKKVSREYLDSVNPDIESAIISIRNGDIDSVPNVIDVTTLDKSTIKEISDFVGFDISGYSCKIERDRLLHIENRHGINGEHDHSLSDPKDTARMGYVLNHSDSIDWVVDSKGNRVFDKQYNDKNNKPSPVIMLNSKIDGTYCISQAVPDSKKKTLWITSARIQKAAVGSQVPYDSNTTPQLQTSETPLVSSSASDSIVSQDNDVVNSSVRNDTKNNTPNLTSKCELIATNHSATGDDIWVITLKDRLSSEEYKDLNGKVKAVGGYYSRFAKTPDGKAIPGFVFKTEPTEREIKVFNDFFNYTEEAAPPGAQAANITNDVLKNKSESDIIEKNTDKDGVENDKSQSEILAGESESDGGGLRAGASGDNAETGIEEADKPYRDNSREGLSESVGADRSGPDVRNDGKGIHGSDDAENVVSEIRGNTAEIADTEPETIDTRVKTTEKKRPSNKGNYVITDDIAAEFDTTPPSAEDNIEAIELLLTLESEGRAATAEEKKTLAKYKGWGGIDPRYIPYELSSRFGKLFNYEQRKAMQSSSNNAFFTPTKVIDAMYNGLKRMGFKGGNILETSMGVGNFFGRMPAAISAKSALTGVELESYTARIAQYLYPGATVINMPFQDVAIKNGSYDLVIGNVPFGQNKISYNKKKYSLHNYFIISSLDKVRDGGIVAVITSAGTLDSHSIDARAAIMDRADVVACYKLPEKVFSRNASTDVQSDLLILRKRSADEKPKGDSILNTITTGQGFRINEYFDKHPENVLGTLAKGHNAWGEITTVLNDGNFYDKLNAAMKKLPKDLISGKVDLKPIETIVSLSDKPRFFEKNGKVYADDGAGTAAEVSKNQANTVRDYIAVRDAYKELLNAYENGETVINADGTATIREMSDEDIKPLRDALSKAYENFYKKHGAITGDGKKKIGAKKSTNNTFLEADADYYLVGGLERYDAKNSTFVKSALFEKDTLRKKRVTSVDVASDALAVSLNESGRIDFVRMQELTGKTEKQLAEELKGEIALSPDGEYVLTDIYLSGNIYEKLDAVKGKPEFKAQQEMLEKVIPTPKDASEITVKLGANYIDTEYIEQFAREVLSTNLTIRKDVSGRWVIEGVKQSRYGDIVNVKYGCDAFNAVQLLEKILNDGEITVTKKVGVGDKAVTVFDAEMTDIARQKADDIRDAFETWIFANTDRRTKIVDNYNRTYNNYRPLDYERIAEKLSFDSMDETLKAKLYPHQKKGIARFLFGGNILFAHGVGTGKTFEMIASVMEAKRMGIINKAAMVVPNNKVVDFKNDIAQAYPNAKVLVIDTANKKRQTMLGLVNSNDWDIVLIARTTFTKIPISPEFQTHYIAQQLEDLELQIAEAENDRIVSKRQLKGMITQRDNLEQKIKDLDAETKRDTNSVEFEKLGIDCICVDEAHNYKSIMTPTKLDIKGLVNRNNAQMANDMLMKLDYLRSIDGKIIFGTGTPITNTVSEIYNMMRMVRPDVLEDAGIHSLDEWVNTFAKIETTTEIGIDNQIKNKSTQIIRSFINVSEMIGMFRQFADIVFTEDVVKNLPKAVYKDVELDGTDEHKQIEQQISEVIAKTKKSDLLKVYGRLMSMADAASVDLRMLSGAESEYNLFKEYSLDELEYKDSKINIMCDNVYEEYTASNDIKGTQIIFCDKGSGSGTVYSFNLHKDIMQKLIDRGIPEEQIVIIKNQSDAQLEALYDKVNAGEVRVLIGTSQKMAEGLNVQKRVVAIHHPTVTYKPSDWEQGNARGIRAGNINDEVRIYRYLQKNTFDSHKWQAQDRKGEMISKALRGELVNEMEDIGADDDGGAGVDAATAMAITSGNPLVKEKIDIDKEVVRLKTLQRNYLSEVYRYQDAITKDPGMINQFTAFAENMEQDITLKNKYGEKSSINIKGKTFEKQSDANRALSEAVKSAPKNGQYTKLGTYNGFDIMFKGDTGGMNYSLILKGSNEYSVEYAANGNNIARFAGVLNRLDAEIKKVQGRIKTLKADLSFAKQEITKPFDKEADLTEALEKQKDITYRYEHYGEKIKNTDNAEIESPETIHSSKDIADTDSISRWTAKRVEGGKDNNINIADIVKDIRGKFGIPVATGKVTVPGASGIYKDKPETIRTRITNNLPTISHELGHHLDKKYNLSKFESVKELRKAVSEEFLNNYPENEKNKEAVAEFVRIYLKNTNDANRLCPDFYSDFTDTLSKDDLKALNGIASSVNEYMSYDIGNRYDAAIVSSQKKERLSFRDTWSKLYTDWVDAYHPMKEAVDYVEDVTGKTLSGKNNAYILATNSLNAHTVANFLICEGFRDLNGNIVNAKSFIDSISIVDAKNVKLLDKYLVLRHSLEWIAPKQEGVAAKRVFADDTLENVEEIKKQIAEIEKEHPEIKTAAENLYEYQNNVIKHFVIPAGGMTEDTLSALNRKYPSYVPFYRAVGKKSGFAKGTFANQRSPIMRAKGSGTLIISPTESIIRNTEKMVKFALRNQVMSIWADYADNVDGFGQFMEKVAPDMIPHFTDITHQKEKFIDVLQQTVSSSEDYFAVSDLFDEIFGDAVADFTPVANANKKIVTVLKNGTPSYYQIHDNAFYNSVAELSPQQTSGLLKVLNAVMQPMKLLITQNNPIFAATNALRDFGTAYKLSEVNNPVAFAAQYVKALGSIIANSESYKQYKAMGGGHSSELSANIDNISKTLRKVSQKDMGKARRLAYSIFVHPVETVASFNNIIETIPRFAEFQRTLKSGGDFQEAIYNADDITTNFKRSGKGETAKVFNKFFLFNNAAIQGLDKTARALTNKNTQRRNKTWLKFVLVALIGGLIRYFWNKEVDEEGYENLSSYKKNNFYNYAIGDGMFISLPKERENAILDSLVERVLEKVSGNDEAFYDFGGYLSSQLLPPMIPDNFSSDSEHSSIENAFHSWVGSTVFGGLADIGFNRDFKGMPIESDYDKYIPSNERYDENTSQLAYHLGQTKFAVDNNLSPKKIDHLISSYTGILGQVNKALFPMNDSRRDTSIGLRNKFISDSNYSTDVLNRMYENQKKTEKAFNYSGSVGNAIEYEKNSVITSYIAGMLEAVKALPEDRQRNGRVYLLKALNNWKYYDTESQKAMLRKFNVDNISEDCIITGVPKSKLEWTDNKQKYTYQMTPREYNEYVNDYLTLVEKYRNTQIKHTSNNEKLVSKLAEIKTEVKKILNKKYERKYKGKATKVSTK